MPKGKKILIGEINNMVYMDKYIKFKKQNGTKQSCINQYKSRVSQLMDYINKDIMTLSVKEIENWCEYGNKNKMHHIRGFIIDMLRNDINNSRSKVSKELLLYLITG